MIDVMKKEYVVVLSTVVALLVMAVSSCKRTPNSMNDEPAAVDTTTVAETSELDFSVPVNYSGSEPRISDFIEAAISMVDNGEFLGDMSRSWEKYKAGQPLPHNRSILLDEENRYMRFDASAEDDEAFHWSYFIEFFCWDYSDGKHKLVITNTVNYDEDGKPKDGQFSGVGFNLFDVETRRMELVSAYSIGFEIDMPDETYLLVYKVFNKERIIECECYTPSGIAVRRVAFNGKEFLPL